MKNALQTLTIILVLVLFGSFTTYAQMELPVPSPKAEVKQTVGVTDIKIEYYSPGVKDRKIWGGLVPYDKMWRTGANAATNISFDKDVKIKGHEVKAGKYAIFTIPGKEKWTVIFNKTWDVHGTSHYKKEDDVLRIEVEPHESGFRERMTFIISNTTYTSARVDLEWEKLRVSFDIGVNTDAHAMNEIEHTLNRVPGNYDGAARYTLRVDKHHEKGLAWINQAIEMEENWYSYWIKAELLKSLGKNKEAYQAMKKTKKLGEQSESFFYKDKVEKALKKWPKQ